MNEYKQYSTLIGSILFVLIVVILFLSPQDIFSSVSLIDTELSEASDGGIPVRIKMDLAQQEELNNLPHQIGDWVGTDQEMSGVKEYLGADVFLTRAYNKTDLTEPVFLLVMQTSNKSGFHPPPRCYEILGYEIEEEGKEEIGVADTAWVGMTINEEELSRLPQWQREEIEFSPYTGWISVKRLIVSKQDNGEITDRRIVLYVYIKDKMLVSDKIIMVQVSALIPTLGSYNGVVSASEELMAEVIPLLFQPHEKGKMFITYLLDWGIGGYFIILLLFCIPLTIIIYPKVLARRRAR